MDPIQHAAELLMQARHAVAFTGAGISTPSGIPDFRSPDTGLWAQRVDPFEVASLVGFHRNPAAFYDWFYPLTRLAVAAQPNPAHRALAELERRARLKAVITQNIDLLHSRAGSKNIYELHGSMRTATCIECAGGCDAGPVITQFLQDRLVPRCPHCNGVLKPDVVLFGEQLPASQWRGAEDVARRCDVMLIVGSSLEVTPAGELPFRAHEHGARLIIVDYRKTAADRLAKIHIHDDAAVALPQIVNQMELS